MSYSAPQFKQRVTEITSSELQEELSFVFFGCRSKQPNAPRLVKTKITILFSAMKKYLPPYIFCYFSLIVKLKCFPLVTIFLVSKMT